jgi:hypothetical protein
MQTRLAFVAVIYQDNQKPDVKILQQGSPTRGWYLKIVYILQTFHSNLVG